MSMRTGRPRKSGSKKKKGGPQKPNIVIESMTNIPFYGVRVRVWREETTIETIYEKTRIELIDALRYVNLSSEDSFEEIIRAICKLPRINAVEVVSSGSLNGVVYYPDWS